MAGGVGPGGGGKEIRQILPEGWGVRFTEENGWMNALLSGVGLGWVRGGAWLGDLEV